MATRKNTVMAIGDSGMPEPTPADQVAYIEVLPLGPGNCAIPATMRSLGRNAPNDWTAARLERVRTLASEDDTPARLLVSYVTPSGRRSSVSVLNVAHARDPLWQGLASRERARIVRMAENLNG